MKVLITGANGMLGEKCIEKLRTRHALFAADLAGEPICPDLLADHLYQPLDITDQSVVKGTIRKYQPEVIVNCAAFTDVDGSEERREQAYAVNVGGVRNLLTGLTDRQTHIIQISTDYVFDGTNGPYGEEAPTNPINYYGWTKLESERILSQATSPVTIIRTNVLFGQSRYRAASFVDWVIRNLLVGKAIRVVSDQYGNPTWADGLAEAIALVIERRALGVYHYGGADYVNRLEFAQLIAEIFGLDGSLIEPITTAELAQKARRPYRAGLVCSKIQQDLQLHLYSLREALQQMKGASV